MHDRTTPRTAATPSRLERVSLSLRRLVGGTRLLLLVALLPYVPALPVRPILAAPAAPSAAPSAVDLLQASDRARGATSAGATWMLDLESREGTTTRRQSFRVRLKEDRARVEGTAPEKHKGEVILLNEKGMWFYKPSLKKPITISSRQKLSGQASHGDIAFTHFQRDYQGTVTGEEVVDGVKTWRLELKAVTPRATYDQIRYWVSQDRRLGLKAEFLTRQGKVFKVATWRYGNSLKMDGKDLPFVSEMTIVDAAFPQNVTTLRVSAPKLEPLDDALFDLRSLAGPTP